MYDPGWRLRSKGFAELKGEMKQKSVFDGGEVNNFFWRVQEIGETLP